LDDDTQARRAAEVAFAPYALRERPEGRLADTGLMRCPWCDHLPSNQSIDTFWFLADVVSNARSRVGVACEADGQRLLNGEEFIDVDSHDDLRLLCPSPACGKTFAIPEELEFDQDPVKVIWNGRDWEVRSKA
jgi:hypothetical protein